MLKPGMNDLSHLSDEKVTQIETSVQFDVWQKLGWVVVQKDAQGSHNELCGAPVSQNEPEPEPVLADEPAHEGYPETLSHLKLLQAKDQVAACDDPDALLRWFETDARSGVKKAIEARIEELEVVA